MMATETDEKPDQQDVMDRNRELRANCGRLMAEAKAKGVSTPTPPLQTNDLLLDCSQLQNFQDVLSKAMGRTPAANAATRAAPRAVAPHVQSATGPAAKPAGAKLTATEQILKARGVNSLGELQAKNAADPAYQRSLD
jgi:hypothetical protein